MARDGDTASRRLELFDDRRPEPVADSEDDPGYVDQPVRGPRHRHDAGGTLRIDPGRPGAVVFCLIAALSAAVAAGLTWISRPSIDPVTPPQLITPAAVDSEPPSEPTEIVVSVIGQVGAPGLVRLPAGSRVDDAIRAAGGLLPEADVSTVNLARVLVDGEQVAVGVPGAQGPAAAGEPAGGGLINLNTASETELDELPGIGPALAGRIVDWREANGGFQSVTQLNDVDGIGPVTFERLRDEVTV
ncbi:ComEA family DNA-binding protein [soil metagenome]